MFKFKFKAVLEYRRQIEERCQQQFAASVTRWEDEKARLAQFYTAWKNCLSEWRLMQQGTVSVVGVDMYQKYMLRLRHEITDQAERVKKCFEQMESKRRELLNARKDAKTMENLEESQLLAYKKKMRRKEDKFFDDISTQRFNYKDTIG